MRAKFEGGQKATTPAAFQQKRSEDTARASAARYNFALRGAQVAAQRRTSMMGMGAGTTMSARAAAGIGGRGPASSSVTTSPSASQASIHFEPHEVMEDWLNYPWGLATFMDESFNEEESAFWVPDLAVALDKQDERAINEAVLRFFFEEHDISRIDEIPALLDANVGREERLFVELARQYPEGGVAPAPAAAPARVSAPTPSGLPPTSGRRISFVDAMASSASTGAGGATASGVRRPSFIVSGVRTASGAWDVNPSESTEVLREKMEEKGETPAAVEAVVAATEAAATDAEKQGA